MSVHLLRGVVIVVLTVVGLLRSYDDTRGTGEMSLMLNFETVSSATGQPRLQGASTDVQIGRHGSTSRHASKGASSSKSWHLALTHALSPAFVYYQTRPRACRAPSPSFVCGIVP